MRSAARAHLTLRRPGPAAAPRVPRRRVLLVEQDPFAAEPLARQLPGVLPAWCRTPRAAALCAAAAGGRCPLAEPVDLVLHVRTRPGRQLAGTELGVLCAGLAGVPVLTAAPDRPTRRQAPWATARCALAEAGQLAGRLLEDPDGWQELRLEQAAARILRLRGRDAGRVEVRLQRWPRAATVTVRTGRPLDDADCAAVRRGLRGALGDGWGDGWDDGPAAPLAGVVFTAGPGGQGRLT